MKYVTKRLLLPLLMLLTVGCERPAGVDPLRRSCADGLNKEAFVNRYRDPGLSLRLADSARRYIEDSLAGYVDGLLRTYNTEAVALYQQSRYTAAMDCVERVERLAGGSPNADIERVIAQLLKARLLQRQCRIADSYRLLYDIGRSGVLEDNRDNLLYNYAQTEYYITMLVLNYHYREGMQDDVRSLIAEVEERRPRLRVDYAQDMALNYALAYGWQSAGESLKALDYCDLNYSILEHSLDTFHLANTLQMTASALRSMPGEVPPDTVLAYYDEARRCFWAYGDAYQILGGVNSTARYALLVGDTSLAREVISDLDEGGRWPYLRLQYMPKMQLSIYDLLVASRYPATADEVRQWYRRRASLQDYVAQSEQEDFVLQTTLAATARRSGMLSLFAYVLGGMLVVTIGLSVLLWRNAMRLRREKRQLEAAKRRDVERIANVETCLSVMRHDISPFVSYLANPDLPSDLRTEVTGQLLRTFDNLKGWTRLSVPMGLTFTPSKFPLQAVFDDVRRQVIHPQAGVELRLEPSQLTLWADRQLVTIMLRNLVNNALQHTASGTVTVGARAEEGDMVRLTVADTGSGMTDEQLGQLFRADKPAGEHGFGLLLCRYIIKQHDDNTRRGCRIWAESSPGQGTSFHCLLARP